MPFWHLVFSSIIFVPFFIQYSLRTSLKQVLHSLHMPQFLLIMYIIRIVFNVVGCFACVFLILHFYDLWQQNGFLMFLRFEFKFDSTQCTSSIINFWHEQVEKLGLLSSRYVDALLSCTNTNFYVVYSTSDSDVLHVQKIRSSIKNLYATHDATVGTLLYEVHLPGILQ